MRTIYKMIAICLVMCGFNSSLNAVTLRVNVEDFEFNPGNFVINLGDTIRWEWDDSAGGHTTTSTTIPVGAIPWNHAMNSGSRVFTYVPSVVGSYHYLCSIHFAMGMVGEFTVLAASGVNDLPTAASLSLSIVNPATNEINIVYDIPKTTDVSIKMISIEGKEVYSFVSATHALGKYNRTFILPDLSNGIYVVVLETKDAVISKKVLLQ